MVTLEKYKQQMVVDVGLPGPVLYGLSEMKQKTRLLTMTIH